MKLEDSSDVPAEPCCERCGEPKSAHVRALPTTGEDAIILCPRSVYEPER